MPVKITSPGASVHTPETYDTSFATENMSWLGAESCIVRPLMREADSQVAGVAGFVGGDEARAERR